MDVEPDTMTRRVQENLAVSGLGERLASRSVDFAPGRPGRHRSDAESLGDRYGVDQTGELLARLPDRERPRHVRPVAVDHRPEVDDDEVTTSDHSVARPSVWHRRVRARSDDRL